MVGKTLINPVSLSGGPLAGVVVEGKGWTVGDTRKFTDADKKDWGYRRLEDDDNGLTSDQAVFTGKFAQ